jgi:hypothetical protein
MNGYPNKRVSDNFVDVIFKILENKTITKSDLKNIHSERILYDNLIVLSGIHKSKSIPTTIEDTAPEMKNRLGLIVGEIEAGNSNKVLLKELHELLFKMSQINLISRSAATKYYNNIKSEFFSILATRYWATPVKHEFKIKKYLVILYKCIIRLK